MTNDQWGVCTDPDAMVSFIEGRASERKLRLLGVACCRRAEHLMTDRRHRDAIEAAERLADGLLTEAEFEEILQPVVGLWVELPDATTNQWEPGHYMTGATRHLGTADGARYAASYVARGLACLTGHRESPAWFAACRAEGAAQCELVRDLFGSPSVPFHFDPLWLNGEGQAAVQRATEIYRENRFESLSSLVDLLEKAGCRDQVLLDHCRSQGPHVRGCWVVDALREQETAVQTGLLTEVDWQNCADPRPLLHFLRDKGSTRQWRLFAVACCRRIDHLITDERSRRAIAVAARYADNAASDEELATARAAAQEAQDEAKRVEYIAEAEANFCLTPAYAATCRSLYAASAARSTVCQDPRRTDAEPGSYDAEFWRPTHLNVAAAVNDDVFVQRGSHQGDDRWEETTHLANAAEEAERKSHCDLLRDVFGACLGPPGEEGNWLPSGLDHPLLQHEQWCRLPTQRDVVCRSEWSAWNAGAIGRLARSIYDDEAFGLLPILADALEEAGCHDPEILEHCRGPGPHVRGCWVVDLLTGRE